MVAYACPSSWEAKAGVSVWVRDQPGKGIQGQTELHSKTLIQKEKEINSKQCMVLVNPAF